ncbi:MAG: type I-C CRISPR-associated protein Cas7/Csd2 [Deltaproteobacteria bacterium]|jgi:CRISPR-associated protein Csd2|nr:type I-C CRISPR-associated protein Cas7/Csd2 [Deltaproteobacteria bacterium]
MTAIQNRYDFVLLFDVENGNPNGDPDAGNMPRIDPETGYGIVTDVCLKRKVRNFVTLTKAGEAGCQIYVREKAVLNQQHALAYKDLNLDPAKPTAEDIGQARAWMCRNFYDVRTFGAVMSTGTNCGQVRGPVQLAFAKSCDPVVPREVTITRMAVTTEKEAEAQKGDNRTMGNKFIIPYALYRMHGFVSAPLAERTGFSEADLELLWQALQSMFEHDRSASRGEMAARGLLVFKHASALGNAPAHTLFERIGIERTGDNSAPTRQFTEYKVTVNKQNLPDGVEILEKI